MLFIGSHNRENHNKEKKNRNSKTRVIKFVDGNDKVKELELNF